MTIACRRLLLSILALCALLPFHVSNCQAQPLPNAPREFRGLWVGYVWNGDWPTRPGQSPDEMRRGFRQIIESAKQARLNGIVLQIRAFSDTIYPSSMDPWSEFVGGRQGQAPQQGFDPLKFAIDECHKNGILIHVWINPFRAGNARNAKDPNHISEKRPDLIKRFGNWLWADPGEPEARTYALNVIKDVLTRYDVDGVHFDDKGFYPYPDELKSGSLSVFPDDISYSKYKQGGGKLSQPDWRRENITTFLQQVNTLVKQTRPNVLVGVSPFGIYRNNEPPGVKGLDGYETLFVDTKMWMNKSLLDYTAPQLYWAINSKQPYDTLVRWWSGQNRGRHLWPGMALYRKEYAADEIPNQITLGRQQRGVDGFILYSAKNLVTNQQLRQTLATSACAFDALPPASPWISSTPPEKPEVQVLPAGDMLEVRWTPSQKGSRPFLYAVYVQTPTGWRMGVQNASTSKISLPATGDSAARTIVVSAVDRLGNESEKVAIRP